ncbi:MAG: hypothetical protein J6M27_07035, partial [Lachnospiraceae bacterium]|nr:hypothetical protein [Lachnospiraceae bacterium]
MSIMTEGRDTKFTEREKNIIGGEFAIHRIEDMAIVPKEGRDLFASGRTALYAILQDAHQEKGCREILLQDYLCDSVTRTIQDYGLSYDFHHIHNDLYPDWESVEERLIPNCAILLINYFGILNLSRFVERLREQTSSPIIIMDDVQNYYGFAQIDHDYAFTSHRKWFPVPDGAMVSKRGGEIPAPTGKNSFAPYKYAGNMLKEMKEVPDEVCLSLLERGERILEQDYMVACSDYGRLGYARLNVRDIKRKRKQ